jgi:hypothetical protein
MKMAPARGVVIGLLIAIPLWVASAVVLLWWLRQ